MSTSINSDVPPKSELVPILPHGVPDIGAAGEGIEQIDDGKSDLLSTIDLVRTSSQISDIQNIPSRRSFACPNVFHVILRIIFYLAVLAVTIGLTLAACKFTNVWDPCEHLYINSTECKVTSYMKGMIYYTECTEERSCILPGFENNVKRQGWSLHKPNDTTTTTLYNSDQPIPIMNLDE